MPRFICTIETENDGEREVTVIAASKDKAADVAIEQFNAVSVIAVWDAGG